MDDRESDSKKPVQGPVASQSEDWRYWYQDTDNLPIVEEPVQGPVASELVTRDQWFMNVDELPYLTDSERKALAGVKLWSVPTPFTWLLAVEVFLVCAFGVFCLVMMVVTTSLMWVVWALTACALQVVQNYVTGFRLRGRGRLAYLDSIDYFGRTHTPVPPPEPEDHSSSDSSYRTLNAAHHAWYGGRSDLDWHDRQMGQTLGFTDGDTYASNWLEHDKD